MNKEYSKVDAINDVRDDLVRQVKAQIKLTGNPYEPFRVESQKDMDLKLEELNNKQKDYCACGNKLKTDQEIRNGICLECQ